jgi:predicted outer membrane protein
MRLIHVLTAGAIAMLSLPAFAASLSADDSTFLQSAIQIQAGRYALASYEQQHGSGRTKSFATSVAAQSAKDSRTLASWAKRYGVTPPKGLQVQDQYHYGQLQGLSGSALDKTFVREFRISDQINLDTYKAQAKNGSDGQLKTYAKQRASAVQQEINALKHLP